MTTLTENQPHDGGFIVSEANGTRSREQVTVLSGENLRAGAVVAKITASGKIVEWDKSQSAPGDGSGTAYGVLFGAVDATAGDKAGVVMVRECELNAGEIVWPTGAQQSEKDDAIATLLGKNIILLS